MINLANCKLWGILTRRADTYNAFKCSGISCPNFILVAALAAVSTFGRLIGIIVSLCESNELFIPYGMLPAGNRPALLAMDTYLLPEQKKVKPEHLIRLFQSRQLSLSALEAEQLLEFLYTLAMLFCQQNPGA